MKATIVDLRYKMSDILKALDRRERVTLLYHGRVKGTIVPANEQKSMNVADHHLDLRRRSGCCLFTGLLKNFVPTLIRRDYRLDQFKGDGEGPLLHAQ